MKKHLSVLPTGGMALVLAGCSMLGSIQTLYSATPAPPIPDYKFTPVVLSSARPAPSQRPVAIERAPEVDTGGGETVSRGSIRGRASWFATGPDGPYGAAGPALRSGNWRGSKVRVCADDCVVVTLNDWCQCYRNESRERVIDLSDEAFARLAPLSAGIINVRVERL
jgi:hypothetical protein